MSTDKMLPTYLLYYDEEIDAICSFELFVECLSKVINAPYYWKWLIISLHNSLQGFMILALNDPRSIEMKNILKEKSILEWNRSFEPDRHCIGPIKLLDFKDLYKKIKSEAMSRSFEPNTTQDKTVESLNVLRNQFVHHLPITSGFDLKTRTKDLFDVILIIEFLAIKSNNILFQKKGRREHIAYLCETAKKEVTTLHKYYGA